MTILPPMSLGKKTCANRASYYCKLDYSMKKEELTEEVGGHPEDSQDQDRGRDYQMKEGEESNICKDNDVQGQKGQVSILPHPRPRAEGKMEEDGIEEEKGFLTRKRKLDSSCEEDSFSNAINNYVASPCAKIQKLDHQTSHDHRKGENMTILPNDDACGSF